MLKVSAAEFQRNLGRYQDLALSEPVGVTSYRRERLVLLSVEEYRRLAGADGAEGKSSAAKIPKVQTESRLGSTAITGPITGAPAGAITGKTGDACADAGLKAGRQRAG